MTETSHPIEVLLVEDDPGDVLMTVEALEHNKVNNMLHVVSDGEQAMAFLRREGEYADVVRPDLVLLDLNLPRKSGMEVLAEIKADDDLRRIPVVILTTSEADEDILRSYNLHANAYVTKPVDFDRFISVVRRIDDFFVSVVKLPR
ncbi:response regulator [Actinomadura spongiicola]|uniref:Response regulator n=1 Tax=Actinomadura spongiicola TaxID=2303421 RepID=A0A372GA12_9ACTN|nr:response regulator [Actinomadura spongiicola]RFS82177.1 response regulator [Actinomadura spongiicola]